jgi:hypothetical protein
MAASLGGDAPVYRRPAPPPRACRPRFRGRAHPKWPNSSARPKRSALLGRRRRPGGRKEAHQRGLPHAPRRAALACSRACPSTSGRRADRGRHPPHRAAGAGASATTAGPFIGAGAAPGSAEAMGEVGRHPGRQGLSCRQPSLRPEVADASCQARKPPRQLEAACVADAPGGAVARDRTVRPAEQLGAATDAVALIGGVQLAAVELGSPGHRRLPTLWSVSWAAGVGGPVGRAAGARAAVAGAGKRGRKRSPAPCPGASSAITE